MGSHQHKGQEKSHKKKKKKKEFRINNMRAQLGTKSKTFGLVDKWCYLLAIDPLTTH